MAPIPGAVDREFVPDSTGTYAVQITTERGCIDTSECKFVEVMSVSTENSKNRPSTNVFPNPFTERIILNNLPYPITEISIVDLSGKLIFEKEKAKGINEIEISTGKFPKGVFIVFFKNEKGTFRRLIIKN